VHWVWILAENAASRANVASAGLSSIGPTPEAIALMGDKVASRAFAAQWLSVSTSVVEDDDLTRSSAVRRRRLAV
jgi:acetyl/propionyl-CoA carboxylase alpha subunit